MNTNMKSIYLITVLFFLLSNDLFAQKMDLIITVYEDSLICKIDSVDANYIYFEAEHDYTSVHTSMKLTQVKEYKRTCISKFDYYMRPGTSFIKKEYNSMYQSGRNAVFITTQVYLNSFNYERIFVLGKKTSMGIQAGYGFEPDLDKFIATGIQIATYGPKNNLEFGVSYHFISDKANFKLGYKFQSPRGFILKLSPVLTINRNAYMFEPSTYLWGELSLGMAF